MERRWHNRPLFLFTGSFVISLSLLLLWMRGAPSLGRLAGMTESAVESDDLPELSSGRNVATADDRFSDVGFSEIGDSGEISSHASIEVSRKNKPATSETDNESALVRSKDEEAEAQVSAHANRTNQNRFDWRGIDLNGERHHLGNSNGCRGIVLVFLATECPISNSVIPTLNRLANRYREQGIEIYGIHCDRTVTRRAAAEHAQQYEIEFPVLFGSTRSLYRRCNPSHTPQAFLLDRTGRIRYSGRIDDRYADLNRKRADVRHAYLEAALSQWLSGEPIQVSQTEPIGCFIEQTAFAGENSNRVTYAREIAPLVQTHCVDCHRPNAVAPFSLVEYEEVAKRARQIDWVIRKRIMPPWKPVDGAGHFQNEMRLSDEEIDLFSAWVADGMPAGNRDDLPPRREFEDGWQLGTPDLILQMPEPFSIPADGEDIYQYFVIPTGLEEDRSIAAIEFRPGNPRVVHHASFCYDLSGEARKLQEASPGPGYRRFGGWGFQAAGTLGGWALGVMPERLPDGTGRRIRRGADFVLQCHYHPTGKPEQDQSTIGIYFASESIRHEVVELIVANMDLRIPPGESEYRHVARYTLPVDTTLLSVLPHMHLLGREAKVTAILPDGRRESLIRIDDWDFNWQASYRYAEPVRLPRGTRIELELVYDNSAENPHNSHVPPKWVQWGEDSTDEMGVCFFDVICRTPQEMMLLKQHNWHQIAEEYEASFGSASSRFDSGTNRR